MRPRIRGTGRFPLEFDTPATTDRIEATMDALKARGITAELLQTREEALARLRTLIPAGASFSTGASLSLKEIGFEELLMSGSHPWRNLKAEYLAEKDPARQTLLGARAPLPTTISAASMRSPRPGRWSSRA